MAVERAVRLQVGVLCLLLVAALARQLSCSRCAHSEHEDAQAGDEGYQSYPRYNPRIFDEIWQDPIYKINYTDRSRNLNYRRRTTKWNLENETISCKPSNSSICRHRDICGKTPAMDRWLERVVGGEEETYGEFPFFARLIFKDGFYCGGVLISNKHVLTSAICLYDNQTHYRELTNLRLGDHLVRRLDADELWRRPANICQPPAVMQPDTKPDHNMFDWALITLKYPVPFSDYLQPACLPFEPIVKTGSESNCWLVGMGINIKTSIGGANLIGKPERLTKMRVEQVSCRLWNISDLDFFHECYMKRRGGRGGQPCGWSDSGSPVLCKGPRGWAVTGTVAYASGDCDGYDGSVWSFVTHRVRTSLREMVGSCLDNQIRDADDVDDPPTDQPVPASQPPSLKPHLRYRV